MFYIPSDSFLLWVVIQLLITVEFLKLRIRRPDGMILDQHLSKCIILSYLQQHKTKSLTCSTTRHLLQRLSCAALHFRWEANSKFICINGATNPVAELGAVFTLRLHLTLYI